MPKNIYISINLIISMLMTFKKKKKIYKNKKSEKQPPKEHKRFDLKKFSYEERKAKLIERLNAFNSIADDDEDDE